MRKGFRIIFESYDVKSPASILGRTIIMDDRISKPAPCLVIISLAHEKQRKIIPLIMDQIVSEKAKFLNRDQGTCKERSRNINVNG